MCFVHKIVGTQRDYSTNSVLVRFNRLEDTIRPVELKFPAPLQEYATDPKGFLYHWESLTYLFSLDDPTYFPVLGSHLSDDETKAAQRFIQTCQNLASYSVLNDSRSLKITSKGGDNWTVTSDFPSHEAFTGFSVTFRQLHNDGEDASFSKVYRVLNKVAGQLDEDEAKSTREVLNAWRDARKSLMKKMVATLVCERLQAGAPATAPKSFQGIVPDELIRTFNYGDSLHWGDDREKLANLLDDEYNENFHKHACLTAMTQLSHLYFGFAELAAAALGDARVSS
ncbi:hypothetical protein G352_24757 [Rhodococcus ruber BKS 20-38]|uniref:Uncharacterized protein n=2 Tax=Rhodococcus ruber TaxID=1830 RepID=M2WU61_9NOCA|nr:hypothetical protein G352_24757 [Rhodococcus ruber BKS 20-38]